MNGGDHLQALEHESIYIIREAVAQLERPIVLFSGGKDSIVLTWLVQKALYPASGTVPLLHIDTGHNFPETLEFRDRFAADTRCELIVRAVQDTIDQGRVRDETGPRASRNALQSVTLLDAIAELQVDAAIGGARRDEDRARAKERIFSHRGACGQWDPKHQRPELWNIYNAYKHPGEHFRVFPLTNWTELDIWHYIQREQLPLPTLYFAHERDVVERDGLLLAVTPYVTVDEREAPSRRSVRFRTVGDATCTGAVESRARTIAHVIAEVATARISERGGRADDRRSEAAMEDRKRQGYF